jgi:hypothetical protein
MENALRGLAMGLLMLFATACPPPPQPGCTAANCRAMVDACRVELIGMPSALCSNVAARPPTFDSSKYCIDLCNAHQGSGKLVQCIADAAPQCSAAADSGVNPYTVISGACLNLDGGTATDAGLVCDADCGRVHKACDDQCTGGSACESCRRMGTPDCSAVCPDAGYASCSDCSATCGLAFNACLDRCPL